MRRALPIVMTLWMLLSSIPAAAQGEGELELRFRRDFGYAAGAEIQGAFSLTVAGPETLIRVDYYLDGELLGTATQPPFRISFNTGDHPLGWHTFVAVGTTADGGQISSAERRLTFVSAEEGWQVAGKIVFPLLGVVLVMMVLGTVVPAILGRKTIFRLGEYGMAGGAVCPRCGMPFSRHLLAPNLLLGKLERCPHCGKTSLVAAASTSALREAESRWQADRRQGELQTATEQERLRREIEDSRYTE